MKAALVLVLAGVFAAGTSQGWTLERARHVLANNVYEVADTSQSDRPEYELTFSPRAAKALRRGFVFAGSAHDTLTDTDVRVRFTFKRPGHITRFHGPAADTTHLPSRSAPPSTTRGIRRRGSVFRSSLTAAFALRSTSTAQTTRASCASTSTR